MSHYWKSLLNSFIECALYTHKHRHISIRNNIYNQCKYNVEKHDTTQFNLPTRLHTNRRLLEKKTVETRKWSNGQSDTVNGEEEGVITLATGIISLMSGHIIIIFLWDNTAHVHYLVMTRYLIIFRLDRIFITLSAKTNKKKLINN